MNLSTFNKLLDILRSHLEKKKLESIISGLLLCFDICKCF